MTKRKQEYLIVASDPYLAVTINKEAFLEKYGSAGQRFIDSIAREERQRVVEMIEELDVYTTWSMSDGRGEERLNKKDVLAIVSDLQSKLESK